MKISRTQRGFTLIELLVVIGIIALLASIALPAFTGVQIKAAQTKALSNAKQIGLCCKEFAVDNNGQYPSYEQQGGNNNGAGAGAGGAANNAVVADSNSAFCQLFPQYLQTISIFYLAKSAYTPGNMQTDPNLSLMATAAPPFPLPAGTNEWAYVTGLYDTSSASYPLIADGFATGSTGAPAYVNNENSFGGVWKGQNAIVVFCDDSARIMKCNNQYMVQGSPQGNLFDTSGQNGWMGGGTGGQVTVVNPLTQ
jgi:prepilin-type N-terminal cleavage/methylation domain-containing protein